MDRGATPRTRDLRDLALGALRDQGITARRLRWIALAAVRLFAPSLHRPLPEPPTAAQLPTGVHADS